MSSQQVSRGRNMSSQQVSLSCGLRERSNFAKIVVLNAGNRMKNWSDYARTITRYVRESVSEETGEITVEERIEELWVDGLASRGFVRWHGPSEQLYGCTALELNLFIFMADRMSYTNEVTFVGALRAEFCKGYGCKDSSLVRALQSLRDYGLLCRLSRGLYWVNPLMCAKCSSGQLMALAKQARFDGNRLFRVDKKLNDKQLTERK